MSEYSDTLGTDMWLTASTDVEAEENTRRTARALAAAEPSWSFLAMARTEAEYESRRALAGPALERMVASVTGGEAGTHQQALDEVWASLDGRWADEHTERQAKVQQAAGEALVAALTVQAADGKYRDPSDPTIVLNDRTASLAGRTAAAPLVKGTDLSPQQRRIVLSAFPYRWTTGNHQRLMSYKPCPNCDIAEPYVNTSTAEGHNHPTMPLITDDEWLAQYAFRISKDGNIMGAAQPVLGGRRPFAPDPARREAALPTAICGRCGGQANVVEDSVPMAGFEGNDLWWRHVDYLMDIDHQVLPTQVKGASRKQAGDGFLDEFAQAEQILASREAAKVDLMIAYDDPKSRCRNCGKAARFTDGGKGEAVHSDTGKAECEISKTSAENQKDCPECKGSGMEASDEKCPKCKGSGKVEVVDWNERASSLRTADKTCPGCGKVEFSAHSQWVVEHPGKEHPFGGSESWDGDWGKAFLDRWDDSYAGISASLHTAASGLIAWKNDTHFGVGFLSGKATNGDVYEVYHNPNMNPTPCAWVNYGPKGDTGPNSGIAESRGFTTMQEAVADAERDASVKTGSRTAADDGYAVWNKDNADWGSVPDLVGDQPGWSEQDAQQAMEMDIEDGRGQGPDGADMYSADELEVRPYKRHSSRTATVACRKCTAGRDPSGGRCDYCDGQGALDATMAMVKAADGWEQGITREAFVRQGEIEDDEWMNSAAPTVSLACGDTIQAHVFQAGAEARALCPQHGAQTVEQSHSLGSRRVAIGPWQVLKDGVPVASGFASRSEAEEYSKGLPGTSVDDKGVDRSKTSAWSQSDEKVYREGWKDGYDDNAAGRGFNLQNSGRSSETGYAEGYYGGFDAHDATPPDNPFEASRRQAVNEDSYGSGRYVTEPYPLTPDWMPDAWDLGKADQATLDQGRAGAPSSNDVSNTYQTTRDTRTRQAARQMMTEGAKYLLDVYEKGKPDDKPTRTEEFDDRSAAETRAQEVKGQGHDYRGRMAATFDPSSRITPGTSAQPAQTPIGETSMAPSQPRSTRPRTQPKAPAPVPGAPTPAGQVGQAPPIGHDTHTDSSGATTLTPVVPTPSAQGRSAYTRPTPDQVAAARVATKVAEMVPDVLAANPGLGEDGAKAIALRTIERFPKMVSA